MSAAGRLADDPCGHLGTSTRSFATSTRCKRARLYGRAPARARVLRGLDCRDRPIVVDDHRQAAGVERLDDPDDWVRKSKRRWTRHPGDSCVFRRRCRRRGRGASRSAGPLLRRQAGTGRPIGTGGGCGTARGGARESPGLSAPWRRSLPACRRTKSEGALLPSLLAARRCRRCRYCGVAELERTRHEAAGPDLLQSRLA